MKAPKKIQKPENWQDFESLCKKLWWEIWKCDEIKKNWRQWQKQNWVDIYWTPKWNKAYYWIQCKWKDDYINWTLTKKEINEEIKKANEFRPKLKKLYFATTWNKDVNIEEFIREKNLENINQWLFEIHLFSWEDIVDLIYENLNTFRYYIESINFKDEYDVELVFDNWLEFIDLDVYFSQKTKKYVYKKPLPWIYWNNSLILQTLKNLHTTHPYFWWEYKWKNMSWWNVNLILDNKWNKQLENYKVYLSFSWNIKNLDEETWVGYLAMNVKNRTVFLYNDDKTGTLKPLWNKPLVPKDSYSYNNIDFKPQIEWWKIYIDWELVSSYYNIKWKLEVNVTTHLINEEEIIEVVDKDEVKQETNIENFYYNEKDEDIS